MSRQVLLTQIFDRLLSVHGPQSWWPADTPFEVMLGAILTQNTAWLNVEKAITGLKEVCDMAPESLLLLSTGKLQDVIRPSGYFRQKATRLLLLCQFLLQEYEGDIGLMGHVPTQELRQQFLDLHGIGPETADSILLYALDRPVFVIDAYTVRLLSRLGLCSENVKYDEARALFMDNLEPDTALFNEYHALIVTHCKYRCQKRAPDCIECCLKNICAHV